MHYYLETCVINIDLDERDNPAPIILISPKTYGSTHV